jgi:hypothetical protein
MASWQPASDSLKQLAACLKDSLSGADPNVQRQAEQVRERERERDSRCAPTPQMSD